MTEFERKKLAKIRTYLTVRKTERTPMELYKEYTSREMDYNISHQLPLTNKEREALWEMVQISLERYNKALAKLLPKPPAKLSSIKPQIDKKE